MIKAAVLPSLYSMDRKKISGTTHTHKEKDGRTKKVETMLSILELVCHSSQPTDLQIVWMVSRGCVIPSCCLRNLSCVILTEFMAKALIHLYYLCIISYFRVKDFWKAEIYTFISSKSSKPLISGTHASLTDGSHFISRSPYSPYELSSSLSYNIIKD